MSESVINRFNEVAAASSVEMISKRLMAACCVASGKVYARQREQRLEIWRELQAVAERQVMTLQSEAPVKRRAPRVKPSVTVAPSVDEQYRSDDPPAAKEQAS